MRVGGLKAFTELTMGVMCVQVVLALMDEADFFGDMFQKFRAAQPESEAWSDIIAFLQELATLAKTLQQMHRSALLSKLTQLGLLEVRTPCLPATLVERRQHTGCDASHNPPCAAPLLTHVDYTSIRAQPIDRGQARVRLRSCF